MPPAEGETAMGSKTRPEESPTVSTTASSIELNFVHQKLETLQQNMLMDVKSRMAHLIDDVMQEIRQHELQTHAFRDFAPAKHLPNSNASHEVTSTVHKQKQQQQQQNTSTTTLRQKADSTWENRVPRRDDEQDGVIAGAKDKKRRALPEKLFVERESYLTALLQVDHMRTVYHIFQVILLTLFFNSLTHDYFVEGRVNFGLGTFKIGFERIHYVLALWLLQHLFVFTLFYAVKGWSLGRHKLSGQAALQSFWSHSCLIVYVSSQLVFFAVATYLSLKWKLPFVSASVQLLETVRLLMKMHAYVRSIAPRVLEGKLKDDEGGKMPSAAVLPPFEAYVYFLFAPTLIYRDHYPRTRHVRWRFAAARFLEGVAVAFMYSYIHERHILVHFGQYGRTEMNASALLVKLQGMLMPSIIIFLGGFYLVLHAWLNFTAELMRFGDRMFYKDWWTSHSYEAFYRNWNVVVHDWLYEYVYKDFYNHVFRGNKVLASLMVFLVSALVHEYLLGFALELFFPVMFVNFGVIGVALVFLTRKAPKTLGNIFLWFSLVFGNGMMISLYCMEYYARKNCPRVHQQWTDYLVPSIWSCYN